MKKLVLFAVAAIAISFASCGNKAADEAAKAQAAADSIAAVQAEEAAKLQSQLAADSLATVQAAADSIAKAAEATAKK